MPRQKEAESQSLELDDLIDELQPGATLLNGQYTIQRFLNRGGFGITYLATDSLDRNVVIKECFPLSVCRRSKAVVAARSRAHTAQLRSVTQNFVREAHNLAKIVHPNIVAVHQVFEENGTAYMAIDFIDGPDLQQVIDGQGRGFGPAQIVAITQKLLQAVAFIHDHDMLHRDIAPDNILINKSGEPILIDFGAVREDASQVVRAVSEMRVVKENYSPQEFYVTGAEQGPWSDLYALGATLYHLISGEVPIGGQARLAALAEEKSDPYVPLAGRIAGYPSEFLEAIDQAMCALPRHRIQSARDWMRQIYGSVPEVAASPWPAEEQRSHLEYLVMRQQEKEAQAEAGPHPDAMPHVAPGDAPRRRAPMKIVAGVVIALAAVAGGRLLIVGGAGPAAEARTELAAPADGATATDAVEARAGVTEASTSTDAAGAQADTTEAPVLAEAVEAQADTTEAPVLAEASAAPALAERPLLENQIAFAAWDVDFPFTTEVRVINGEQVAPVGRLDPNADLAMAGNWLARGLTIHTVNGVPLKETGSLASGVLRAMQVDPDGFARVVVGYRDRAGADQVGLLTVKARRLIVLANGVTLQAAVSDGVWQTVVTNVTDPALTTLVKGDVLFRDKTTEIALDAATSLEAILPQLVDRGIAGTEFSVIRDRKVTTTTMRLQTKSEL